MRGLKREKDYLKSHLSESHLLQMRGLKLGSQAGLATCFGSHLLQMRGLKHLFRVRASNVRVASFTDAWIETGKPHGEPFVAVSHLLQMRGLKLNRNLYYKNYLRRIFYRCVD